MRNDKRGNWPDLACGWFAAVYHVLGVQMRLYVSGPVTGKENRNIDDFKQTAAFLKDAGYKVVIPTDLVNEPPTMTREQITCRCLSELLNCDGVALLRGWRRSSGACLEVAVATACGKDAKAAEAWLE